MIMPSTIPIADPNVQEELTRYLPPNWVPVIEKDVDGDHSLSLRLDNDNPNLGRYSACRRVARTIYMGSAPIADSSRRGIDDRRVKLGCVQPGESVPIFGDALRRLTDQATHLYVDGSRYWYSTQPSVTRLAQDRATQQDPHDVIDEITARLKLEQKSLGEFAKVYPCPASSGEVPDEVEARLVILSPESPHIANTHDSAAMTAALDMLEHRGTGPRINRNTLVFVAADKTRLGDLDAAVRQHLAWKSIFAEKDSLNLDPFQTSQARTKATQADETVQARIPETYQWLIVPGQPDPQQAIEWKAIRLQGVDRLAVRASKKLINEGDLILERAGSVLRLDMDKIPLWRGNHVGVKMLTEDVAKYLYLPRFKNSQVLLDAIRDGVASLTWVNDTFAYADGFDTERNRYRGLKAGQRVTVIRDSDSVLVKPNIAEQQLDAERAAKAVTAPVAGGSTPIVLKPDGSVVKSTTAPDSPDPVVIDTKPRRFHGSVQLDSTRVGRDASRIADEVIAHLSGQMGAEVTVTLEIEVRLPNGATEQIVRTVTENSRTLKFTSHGFESE
jgi:hypothetical protein